MRDRASCQLVWKQHKQDSEMVTQFKQELQQILTQLTLVLADLLANRLVGHQIIGQSQQQLAQKLTIALPIVTIRLLDAQPIFCHPQPAYNRLSVISGLLGYHWMPS